MLVVPKDTTICPRMICEEIQANSILVIASAVPVCGLLIDGLRSQYSY
jgi:hypothetical protein